MTVALGSLKPQDSKVHFCIVCDFPVGTYGRVWPCLHTYCLSCAAQMPKCALCQSEILRVERVTRDQVLFISPATLQSFKCMNIPTQEIVLLKHIASSLCNGCLLQKFMTIAEEDLQTHAEEVQARLSAVG